jgi:flagellar hook-length control protein FliK
MIRSLHGREATDATRALPHTEPLDVAADQELADEFEELLERARGRVSSAGEEISALSIALAQAQTAIPIRQQAPVETRERVVPLEKNCEKNEEDIAEEEGQTLPAKAECAAQGESPLVEEHKPSDVPPPVEHEELENSQPNPQENPEKSDMVDGVALKVLAEGEEEGAIAAEVVAEEVITPKRAAEYLGGDKASSSKEEFQGTQKPLEFEVAPEKVKTALPIRSEARPEEQGQGKESDSVILKPEDVESLSWRPTADTSGSRASVSLPTDTALNRSGDMSIQMAILRQAFESVKGFSGGRHDANPKSGSTPSQSVGAASESRSTPGDIERKSAKPMTRAQMHRMLERVETAMKEAARSRDGKTIRFRVEPFNLGEVKVDVSLREGLLHARLKAENQQVTAVLRDRAHELQGALRKLGLDVDNVTVTVSEDEEARFTGTQQDLSDGKSYQDERNNMPGERAQVVENRIGNELADVSAAGPLRVSDAILDHWVA